MSDVTREDRNLGRIRKASGIHFELHQLRDTYACLPIQSGIGEAELTLWLRRLAFTGSSAPAVLRGADLRFGHGAPVAAMRATMFCTAVTAGCNSAGVNSSSVASAP